MIRSRIEAEFCSVAPNKVNESRHLRGSASIRLAAAQFPRHLRSRKEINSRRPRSNVADCVSRNSLLREWAHSTRKFNRLGRLARIRITVSVCISRRGIRHRLVFRRVNIGETEYTVFNRLAFLFTETDRSSSLQPLNSGDN